VSVKQSQDRGARSGRVAVAILPVALASMLMLLTVPIAQAYNDPASRTARGTGFVTPSIGQHAALIGDERFMTPTGAVDIGYWFMDGIGVEYRAAVGLDDVRRRGLQFKLNLASSIGLRFEGRPTGQTSAYMVFGGSRANLSTRFLAEERRDRTSNLEGYHFRIGVTYRLPRRALGALLDFGLGGHRFDSEASMLNYYLGVRFDFAGPGR